MSLLCEGRQCNCSLDNLSPREYEVLEHLALRKTSKQIAHDLGIRCNTVDKHLDSVRARWGTRNRNETARAFTELVEGGKKHPSDFLPGDAYLITRPDLFSDLPMAAEFRLSDVLASEPFRLPDPAAPAGLEALDARFGKVWRIAAVPVAAILIGMVAIVMIAITQALSELL